MKYKSLRTYPRNKKSLRTYPRNTKVYVRIHEIQKRTYVSMKYKSLRTYPRNIFKAAMMDSTAVVVMVICISAAARLTMASIIPRYCKAVVMAPKNKMTGIDYIKQQHVRLNKNVRLSENA